MEKKLIVVVLSTLLILNVYVSLVNATSKKTDIENNCVTKLGDYKINNIKKDFKLFRNLGLFDPRVSWIPGYISANSCGGDITFYATLWKKGLGSICCELFFVWDTTSHILWTAYAHETDRITYCGLTPHLFSITDCCVNRGTTYYSRAVAINDNGYLHQSPLELGYRVGEPDVETNPATNIGFTNAILNGDLEYGGFCNGSTCDVWFVYDITPHDKPSQYANSTTHQTKSSSGNFNQEISNLNLGTKYYYRAVASNDAGSDYGTENSFVTWGACYIWEDADGVEPGTLINFDASCSSGNPYSITDYDWDWESDGFYDYFDDDPYCSYDYQDYLEHNCTLRITNTDGQTDTITKTVNATVENLPIACFNWEDTDGHGPGTTINFNASCSYSYNGTIVLFEWDFTSDGNYDSSSGSPFTSYTYGDYNPHDCTLRVTNDQGLLDIKIKTVQAENDNPPVACYVWEDADGPGPGTQIDFDASCSTDDYGIVLYEWDWTNDGIIDYSSTSPYINHDYGDYNDHNCKLIVTDTIGQTNFIIKTVNAFVDNPPVACYVWEDADGPGPKMEISFDAGCSTDDHGIVMYEWDWTNDGVIDYSTTSQYAFFDYGYYNMYECKLIVTDTIGQTDSVIHMVNAGNSPPNPPQINGPTSGNTGQEYDFTFIATDPNNDDLYYQIDWGDGGFQDWFGPFESNKVIIKSHTWNSQGEFIIKARVKDVFGIESDWSTLAVNIPRNKGAFFNFFEQLINHFSILKILFSF